MTTITALHRDTFSGLCELVDVTIDSDRTPVTKYGYVYELAGAALLEGWGTLDGNAVIWQRKGSYHQILVPTT